MKKKLNKLSIYSLIISAVIFIFNFFFFHFVNDDGTISKVFNEEAGKPFVAMLIGFLATLFLFTAIISFIASRIFCDKGE